MTSAVERLRALLGGQVPAPLTVTERGTQYWFDEDSAAYAEIDVRRGDAFLVVVVLGSPIDDTFIARVWLRRAAEVWFVEPDEQRITRVLRGGAVDVLRTRDTLSSPVLPGVLIPVGAVFLPT